MSIYLSHSRRHITAATVQSNTRHVGKNTAPNWIVLIGVNSSFCLVCGSGLVWSASMCQHLYWTFIQTNVGPQAECIQLRSKRYAFCRHKDTTGIFHATAVSRTPSVPSFSYHVLYKNTFKMRLIIQKIINTHTHAKKG